MRGSNSKCQADHRCAARPIVWRSLGAAFLAGFLGLISSAPGYASCPIGRSRYRLIHDRQYSAGFYQTSQRQYSRGGLTLFVHSAQTNQTYWFFFDNGSGRYMFIYSTISIFDKRWLLPDSDHEEARDVIGPLDVMTIIFADRDFRLDYELPDSARSEPRPEYVLISDLPAVLAAQGKPPERPPLDFFKFDHCAKPGALDL